MEGEAVNTVTSALTTGLSTVATDAMSAIAAIVPVALPILGAIIVVGVAIRIFRKFSGR